MGLFKKIKDHFRLWNRWRKRNLNGSVYKLLVLFGLVHSPTFDSFVIIEEAAQSFYRGVEDGFKNAEKRSTK